MAERYSRRGRRIGRPPGHDMSRTPTYRAWLRMKAGCNNPKAPLWWSSGALGVGYDLRWEGFLPFLLDMGECPPGHGLARRDRGRDYDRSNCLWVPRAR